MGNIVKRGKYKKKEKNIEALKYYLNKIKKDEQFNRLGSSDIK